MLHLQDRVAREVSPGGAIFDLLPDDLQAAARAASAEDIASSALNVLIRPQPEEIHPAGRLLMNACLGATWLCAFEEVGLPRDLRAFEPCAGSSEPVLLATEAHSGGTGSYVTLNLNRPLAAQLRAKLGKLRMDWEIIEDYAQVAGAHLEPGTCDVACFHHAVNDILQTAVSEPRGMDTRSVDWWPNERQMIEWLAEDHAAGRLDERARPALVEAVRQACELVKPGGWLIFDHWTWVRYESVDWFPFQLFSDLIPMAREWVFAAGLPVTERALKGRDPRWWMCLRRE